MRYLDTNVIIRYLTRDDEKKAAACYRLFERVSKGREELTTSAATIAEATYVLSSQRGPYRLPPDEIAARLHPIVSLRGLVMPDKRVCIRALDLYAQYPFLDFADALGVAQTEARGITEILSYDRDFDRLPEVARVEP
ncbi:MAG: PIN domain-containing protein [bacterium]|nr:PIN domain-containing protein [bacterium]MDE0353735.1 PIN domain-containing protein [bacterium]